MTAVETTFIQKTPNVCGGKARIRDTRIAVWGVVMDRRLGLSDPEILQSMPTLTQADIDACWEYFRNHPIEIERSVWLNDTSANVPEGAPVPAAVVVAGLLLGVPAEDVREAFEPPLSDADLDAAWAAYRADPARIGREIASHRLAG